MECVVFGVQSKAEGRAMARPQRAEQYLPQEDASAPAYISGGGIPDAARSPLLGAPRATLWGHSKELQHSHVPQKTCNPPRNELTTKVNVMLRKMPLWIIGIKLKMSDQLQDLGSSTCLPTTPQGRVRWEPADHPGIGEPFLPARPIYRIHGSGEAGRRRPTPRPQRYKAYAESHRPIRHGGKERVQAAGLPAAGPDAARRFREFSG